MSPLNKSENSSTKKVTPNAVAKKHFAHSIIPSSTKAKVELLPRSMSQTINRLNHQLIDHPSSHYAAKQKIDRRYSVLVKSFQEGVVVAWIQDNHNYSNRPYVNPFNLQEEGYFSEFKDYSFVGLIDSKSYDDQNQNPMQQVSQLGPYNCKQFLFLIDDQHNTSSNRLCIAFRLAKHINKNVKNGNILTFPHIIFSIRDITPEKLGPVSDGILDVDITNLSGYKNYNRLLLFIKGYQEGVVVAWIQKPQSCSELSVSPEFMVFEDGFKDMQDLGFVSIKHRRGCNGKTPMKHHSFDGSYNWKQFLFLVAENSNTHEHRLYIAEKLVEHLNKYAGNGGAYEFAHKIKLADDLTADTLQPASETLLDEDVKYVMQKAYPGMALSTLSKHDDIMKTFWSNIAYGKAALLQE